MVASKDMSGRRSVGNKCRARSRCSPRCTPSGTRRLRHHRHGVRHGRGGGHHGRGRGRRGRGRDHRGGRHGRDHRTRRLQRGGCHS